MAKIVTRLKKKHRDHIWRDEEGDFWFWHPELDKWCVLLASAKGGFHVNPHYDPQFYSHFERVAASPMAGAPIL